MIGLSAQAIFALYVIVFLAGVFALWIASAVARNSRLRRAMRHRVRCVLCAFECDATSPDGLVRCPRCGALNECVSQSHLSAP